MSDIPGNRPEDEADEAFYARLAESLPDDLIEALPSDWYDGPTMRLVELARDIGYEVGRAEQRAEAQIEAAMTPNPTFTDDELHALAGMLGGELFREDVTQRRAVQKVLAATAARDPDRPF